MTSSSHISPEQLKRLQTLYSQFAAASGDPAVAAREQRLGWASLVVNRAVESFGQLTREEAKTCIDRLQGSSRQKSVASSQRRMDRGRSRRHGVDGRHDGAEFNGTPELASRHDLDVIEGYMVRLGWSRAQFEAWLRSPRSPVKGSCQLPVASCQLIRTVAEANRVRWALVKMLKAHGLWLEKKSA